APAEAAAELAEISTSVRRDILTTIQAAGMGHVGGDLSVTDLLVTAMWGTLQMHPTEPGNPRRDRFVLSKGHCAAALYSTLASCGFFPRTRLNEFMGPLSPLNGHPARLKVPGVETNTGPLGHGFPVATGCALGATMRGETWRTIVVLGDGELQEGSNWEAAMTAAHYGL
ncbi:1-deoxy-D-xylulose-5-phosphate synthase N-terminal domain-containing protein, partial [Streptomyces sp. MCAF7]